MKLEVGMYCRYKNFQNKIKIAKIKGIQKADEVFRYDYISFDNDDGELETNIIKASYNIVDVLEVGDYVNGHKVTRIGGTYHGRKDRAIYCDYQQNEKTKKWIMIYDDEIKSIVTKEQFEEMSYKIEE